jgi:hypothetical protein
VDKHAAAVVVVVVGTKPSKLGMLCNIIAISTESLFAFLGATSTTRSIAHPNTTTSVAITVDKITFIVFTSDRSSEISFSVLLWGKPTGCLRRTGVSYAALIAGSCTNFDVLMSGGGSSRISVSPFDPLIFTLGVGMVEWLDKRTSNPKRVLMFDSEYSIASLLQPETFNR